MIEIVDEKTTIDEIKDSAAQGEAEGSGFMDPGTKKKRGKYKKRESKKDAPKQASGPSSDDQKAEQAQIPTKQILMPLVALGSSAAAKWADDPRAAMAPAEMECVATVAGQLIDKWIPNVLDKYGLEAMFVIVLSQYTVRVVQLKRARDLDKGARGITGNQNPAPFSPQSQASEPEAMPHPHGY